jgi:hypothetical protein
VPIAPLGIDVTRFPGDSFILSGLAPKRRAFSLGLSAGREALGAGSGFVERFLPIVPFG